MRVADFIAKVPLFMKLPEAALCAVSVQELTRGTTLFAIGESPRFMHAVINGEIRLIRRAPNGSEIVLQRAQSGIVAEASLDQPAYHCHAIAARDTTVLRIPIGKFRLALEIPAFRNAWIAHLSSELRSARAIAERANLKTARERIIHYIETEGRAGEIQLDRSRMAWAGELGLTHEALYRTLRVMRERGELEVTGRRVYRISLNPRTGLS